MLPHLCGELGEAPFFPPRLQMQEREAEGGWGERGAEDSSLLWLFALCNIRGA